MARKIVIVFIKFYQVFVSPITHWLSFSFFGTSVGCRFELSCSRYAAKVFSTNNLAVATWLVLKRLGRCHTFN